MAILFYGSYCGSVYCPHWERIEIWLILLEGRNPNPWLGQFRWLNKIREIADLVWSNFRFFRWLHFGYLSSSCASNLNLIDFSSEWFFSVTNIHSYGKSIKRCSRATLRSTISRSFWRGRHRWSYGILWLHVRPLIHGFRCFARDVCDFDVLAMCEAARTSRCLKKDFHSEVEQSREQWGPQSIHQS